MLITTIENLSGKKIKEIKGLVEGVSVQTKNIFKDVGASLKSVVGGKLSGYEQMIHVAKDNAKEKMITEAQTLGANAIIGFKYSTTNTTAGGSAEVLAYGTAVVL